MSGQEIATWATVGIGLLLLASGIASIVWRMGKHQATMETNNKHILAELKRMNGSISEAHHRLDDHLEAH